jgi:hypothetical protein
MHRRRACCNGGEHHMPRARPGARFVQFVLFASFRLAASRTPVTSVYRKAHGATEMNDTLRQPTLHQQRMSAEMPDSFVVFLIGLRFKRLWKVHKWLPPVLAMNRMLKELSEKPELGLLSFESFYGRTTLLLQYWESKEKLLDYAINAFAEHIPAWKAFNRAGDTSSEFGIWHETYLVTPGHYEAIYVNMPPFGLGKAGKLHPAHGKRATAKDRLDIGHGV